VVSLKDNELKIIAELMKNSRRSDRELARVLKISQPTVTRIRRKLEEEGFFREFTVIPNFNKLGYSIFALTFFKWKEGLGKEKMEEARKWGLEQAPSVAPNVVLIERGLGLGYDSFMASFHKDYSSYTELISRIKTSPYLDSSRIESFIVNLEDNIHYRYLTFSTLAEHLLAMKPPKKE
jgi:DNA-binding Lrp family transcriptional regulator